MSPRPPSYINALASYAIRNPHKVYRAASSIYTAARNYVSPSKQTPSYAPATRTRFVGSKVINPQYRYKRGYGNYVRRVYYKKTKKVNKVNRLVGKAPRTSVYNRRSKTMRTNNTGKLSLQHRLQNGGALPNTTYARLFWRATGYTPMLTRHTSVPVTDPAGNVDARTFILNDISSSPSYSTNLNMRHNVTYAPMWQSLYKKYLVLGASFKVKIKPTFYPSLLANASTYSNAAYSYRVPMDAQPGYWYVRAFYNRSHSPGTATESVGHPIRRANTAEDPKTEKLWDNLRDFLSDPTVSYKRDSTNIRTKLHIHNDKNALSTDVTSTLQPSTGTSYEIETSTKPVILKCNFSAKKHFQDKNPLRNQPFVSWDSSLNDDYGFQVRIGYIGFDATGVTSYHLPLDRNVNRSCDFEIQYFVALRDPKITPHDEALPALESLRVLDDTVLNYEDDPNYLIDQGDPDAIHDHSYLEP